MSAVIRRELRRMEPDLVFLSLGNTLREIAAVVVLPLRVATSVAGAAAIVAMLLGAIGLYGVVAYLVTQRTREFAIRSTLGARTEVLLRLVVSTGAWMLAVGVAAGAILAVVLTRAVAWVVPVLVPTDPVVWAGALLLIVGVGTIAYVGPARQVIRLNLTQALRVD